MTFKTWHEAHDYAQAKANEYGQSYGIEAAREYGKPVFCVAMIPNDPAKRFGWEFRCEAVEPMREAREEYEGGSR